MNITNEYGLIMKNRLTLNLFICAASAMVLASCGGGDSSTSAATPAASNNVGGTLGGPQSLRVTPAWVMQAYQQLFPTNPAGYTAQTLSDALAAHNVLLGQDTTQQVYNFAGFLANAAHESGSFVYMTELNTGGAWSTDGKGVWTPGGSYSNCQGSYGGTGSVCYYGRGALQISHNYNYQVYGATNGVFANPDLILGSGAPNYTNNLLFDSAVWFWSDDSTSLQTIRPMDGFKVPSNQYAATDPFGQSIKVINGGIECGPGKSSAAVAERNDRISRFISYLPVVAAAAQVPLISGYSTAADGTIGVACSSGPPAATFQINIQNTGSTYASVIFQAPDYSTYYYIGTGNIAIAPGANINVGTTPTKLPNISTALNTVFPSTVNQIAIPRITIGTYSGAVDITTTNPTNGSSGKACNLSTPIAATFNANTSPSIIINADTGTCTLTNP